MLEIKNASLQIHHINIRKEFKGEDAYLALDIKFTAIAENGRDVAAALTPALLEALWDENKRPALGGVVAGLDHKVLHLRAVIERNLLAWTEVARYPSADLASVTIEPLSEYRLSISGKLQTRTPTGQEVIALWQMINEVGHKISIEETQPDLL